MEKETKASDWVIEGDKKYYLPTMQACVNIMYSHQFNEMDLEDSIEWFEQALIDNCYSEEL